jgi:pimeloyl-ACP methyl ester carboxylesterase
MQSKEIQAAGELLGAAVGGTGSFVRDMHQAVAQRTFRALGPLGGPVRVVHDRVSETIYEGVRRGLAAGPRAGAMLLSRRVQPQAPALAQSVVGGMALGALNGAIGDVLSAQGSELALSMSLFEGGEPLAPEREALAAAFPQAGPRIVLFVHGLCETDDAWRLLPLRRGAERAGSYGTRLQRELGFTPLYLRYNTGLHISDNGRRLSRLLDEIVAAWPVAVEEIVLVGHSMGGLVARSACHYGELDGARWVSDLRHVFCLGSPHLGAPLEKAANLAGWALNRVPEMRPLAKLVNGRSVGIKDLRFGSCAEEDWCDCEPDEFLRDRCREVPFVEHANYYFIGATLSRSPEHPLGSLVGDLLVRLPSASGAGRRRKIPFPIDNGLHLGGLTHFDLLNHPAVYAQLCEWIKRPHAGPAPALAAGAAGAQQLESEASA